MQIDTQKIHLFIITMLLFNGCKSVYESDNKNLVKEKNVYLSEIFVNGFNTGNPDSLALAVSKIFTADFLENNGGPLSYGTDRLELFRTYGPLKFDFNDTTVTPNIVWYKGIISNAWIGYQFYTDTTQKNKAQRLTTWRARPIPYPNYPHSEVIVADSLGFYIEKMTKAGLFSGSVTLSHKGKIFLNKSWGTNKWNNPDLINNETRFHIASVTKLFTTVLTLKLVEQGILSLDDTLGKYIPEFPNPYRSKVKVIHLLTHTSGIEIDNDINFQQRINSANNVEDLLSAQLLAIKNIELVEPGTEYNYTSEGFDLLGVIIKRVTNKSWKENIEEKIFKPIGMIHSRVNLPKAEGNYAIGKTSLNENLQTSDVGVLKNAFEILPKHAKPSGGIWSNAKELHMFMNALLNYTLLNKEWTDEMLSINRITYENQKYGIKSWVGLGIQGEDLFGTPTLGHGGVVPGFSTAIEYLPETEWLLTVTSNSGEASGFLVFQRFLELTANYKN